jgi:hypothetical protein
MTVPPMNTTQRLAANARGGEGEEVDHPCRCRRRSRRGVGVARAELLRGHPRRGTLGAQNVGCLGLGILERGREEEDGRDW